MKHCRDTCFTAKEPFISGTLSSTKHDPTSLQMEILGKRQRPLLLANHTSSIASALHSFNNHYKAGRKGVCVCAVQGKPVHLPADQRSHR